MCANGECASVLNAHIFPFSKGKSQMKIAINQQIAGRSLEIVSVIIIGFFIADLLFQSIFYSHAN